MSPEKVFKKPFAEWPQPLRAAFIEGWAVAKIGVGKSVLDVVQAGGPGIPGVLAGAAWELGKLEALGGVSP